MNEIMTNKKGFTIVELMISTVIFTIGFLSAYLLIYSAINSSIRSKNEIIASNIAREQIELLKNIRDTNWLRNNNWDYLDEYLPLGSTGFFTDYGFYSIENSYNEDPDNSAPIKIKKLSSTSFFGNKNEIINSIYNLQLCIDDLGRYKHCEGIGDRRTKFYSFIKIEPLITVNKKTVPNDNITVTGAIRIESIVANTERGYNEFRINTIITDWKK